jgi:hypothetical protein
MAATDARPVAKKNLAFRFYFAIRKNDGTLITTWTGQDSEVDKDGAGFNDCTNEATEISTSGVGYIDLTSTEMNADAVTLKVTVTNTSALPLVVTFFPEEDGDIRANTTQFGGTTVTGRDIGASVLLSSGTGTGQVKLSSGYVAPNWGDVGNPTTTVDLSATTINTGAIVNAILDAYGTRVTAQTGSSATAVILDAGASAVDDYYNGSVLVFTSGNLNGQARKITDYVGSTKTATVTAFTTSPANGDTATILGRIE